MIAFEALRFKKGSGCAFRVAASDEQSPSCGFHSGNASFPEPFRGIELGFVRLGFK